MSLRPRLLGVVAAGAAALALTGTLVREPAAGGRLTTSDGDTVEVSAAARRAGLAFAPGVAAGDRVWIRAAVTRARPEAARLIAEVDGLVTVGTYADAGPTLGVTRAGPSGFAIDVNVAFLNGRRQHDRATVVLHELGHVIDFTLVPAALNAALDHQVPRGGRCGAAIDCDRLEERFADTFAKWALHGAVSEVGAGYGIAMPASLEGWGQPLARLAFGLPTD